MNTKIYNTHLDLLLISIKRNINEKLEAYRALSDFNINELLKIYGSTNNLKTHNKLTTDNIISKMLKIRGYDKIGNIYTKGFVYVVVEDDCIHIKHDVKNSKSQIIDSSLITGLSISLNYYERI